MSGIENLCDQLASTTVEENEKDKEVSFAGRSLKLDTESDANEIVKALDACQQMATFCLEGNTLGIPAAKAIAKALEKQSNFKRALWKDMFTQRTVEEIPQVLSHLSKAVMLSNAHLVKLDLSDNAFGPRGLIGIVGLLQSSSCYTLQELHLNNNGLGISGAKMFADAMCKCVENSKRDCSPLSLKIFVCGRNRLENEGATAIAMFFKMLGTLESVAMPQNGIYAPGTKALADAFMLNQHLKVINLEDNSLTEEGAMCIAKCLPSLKEIHMLNFGDCLIRTKGAFVLAEVLKENCQDLRELYLGFNEINKEGGKAIVDAMENKIMLDILILNGNFFGEDGCEEIQNRMSKLGLSDKLGTLSEDEGDEEDDDYENVEDEESDSANEDPGKLNKISDENHTSPMQKISPKDFYNFPTTDALLYLKNAEEDLLSILSDEAPLCDYLILFLKVCSVVKPGDDQAKLVACTYVDDILSKALNLYSNDISNFNNTFLVRLRLLKEEDMDNFGKVDISGALLVLQHVVKQSYFHKSTRELLQFFLSRPLNYATACEKTKHALMQILYTM